ncbi:MAG: VOC family protein [Myxococcota bacterium]
MSTTNGHRPQPMAAFVKLLVSDVGRSVAFYLALGFEEAGRDAVFVHLRWASRADLYLVHTPSGMALEGKRGTGVLVGFTALDPDVDTVAQRARAQGAVVDGPRDQPWHTREVVVTDPDGYRLNFVRPI